MGTASKRGSAAGQLRRTALLPRPHSDQDSSARFTRSTNHASRTLHELPTVADVDGEGDTIGFRVEALQAVV